MPRLQKLTLPFALDAAALRALARLPALAELYTFEAVDLDGAAAPVALPSPLFGPCPGPGQHPAQPIGLSILAEPPVALRAVTRLVAAALRVGDATDAAAYAPLAPRHELGAVFPALRCMYLKRATDGALALAAGAAATLEALSVRDGRRAGDSGVALLRACRGLARLQLDDAPLVSDAALAKLFEVPHASLQHLTLRRLPGVTDEGMQAVSAGARRLVSASLGWVPNLTNKTLARMGRMERLSSVTLVRMGPGVTAEGVRALAGAPAMAAVTVAACAGVRGAGCRQHRPAVRVRVDDADV